MIRFKGGRHPLIGSSAVPLDFSIGEEYQALIITGPNTGGKTVALKTVGLFAQMVQAGLHIPVEEGDFAVFSDILVDIGDGQSIEQSLSTFSAHIKNINGILASAHSGSLVILDELGAGTDPGEGMGLAIALLEALAAKEVIIVASTHFNEIKEFARGKKGFENGSMAFDLQTLRPLYRLDIGRPGESNAFLIALRLGLDKKVVERAHEITYKEKKEYRQELTEAKTQALSNKNFPEANRRVGEEVEIKKGGKAKAEKPSVPEKFKLGDCVVIKNLGKTGIVCETENRMGEIGILYQGKKIKLNQKRLALYIEAEELYPEGYDLDIVLESKETRKKRHLMSRKYVEGLTIETPGGQDG